VGRVEVVGAAEERAAEMVVVARAAVVKAAARAVTALMEVAASGEVPYLQ